MASPEPPVQKMTVPVESAVKDLLRRLSAESVELAEKAGIPEPTTPPPTGAGFKIEKNGSRGIEANAIAGLRDAIQSSKAWEDLVEVVKGVKSLKLAKGLIGDKGVASLSRALRDANVTNLLNLDLSNNGFTDQGFHELTQTIATGFLSSIESFNLSHNHIREEGSGHLARILHIGSLPALQNLNLSHCYIGDYGVENVATAMQSTHFASWGLQSINLSTNAFGEQGALALSKSLSMGRLPYLKHLDLSFNLVGEKGTLALADALNSGNLSGLTGLILSRCYLGHGVVPISQAMEAGKVSNLKLLDLSSNNLGDRGSMALANALRSGKLSKLQELVIAECGIPSTGLAMIPEALEFGHVWGLRHLDLSNNFVNSFSSRDVEFRDRHAERYGHVRRDVGSFALAKLMRSGGLGGLQYLNLSRISMTDEGLIVVAGEMEAGHARNLERFLLTDNEIGSGRSMKYLTKALVSPNLPKLQELDLGHNVDGEDLSMNLINLLEDTQLDVESPLVRKLKERKRMSKSPIERFMYKVLGFLETQLGFSLRYRPSTSDLLKRYWQRQAPRSLAANDEEVAESTGNDSKVLFNVLLVVVWIVAVWMTKW